MGIPLPGPMGNLDPKPASTLTLEVVGADRKRGTAEILDYPKVVQDFRRTPALSRFNRRQHVEPRDAQFLGRKSRTPHRWRIPFDGRPNHLPDVPRE